MVRADGTTRAVLFDVFGTLVDYQPDRRRLRYPSTCDLLRRWGHEMSAGAFVERWDAASTGLERASAATLEEFSMLDAATAFAAENDLPLSEAECRELAATFLAEWQIHLVPVGGAADLLVRLAHHVTIGVVSNTHDADMVPAILRSMGVAHLVAVVFFSPFFSPFSPEPRSSWVRSPPYVAANEPRSARATDWHDRGFVGCHLWPGTNPEPRARTAAGSYGGGLPRRRRTAGLHEPPAGNLGTSACGPGSWSRQISTG